MIVFLGPAGSGKGTQATFLKDKLNYIHLSTGDLLRKTANTKTSFGNEINEIMKKGDLVMLNWHIINMDADLFESPLEFNVTRAQDIALHREHRAFGNGEHFCLGAHLARLELQIMFKEILPRLRNPKFSKPVQYVRDNLVNGIKEMYITFDPEAA